MVAGLITHQEHKKSADLHQAAEIPWRFLFGRSLSRTSTLLGHGTLPSPTAGSRIRFPRSLLMLKTLLNSAGVFVKLRNQDSAVSNLSPSPRSSATSTRPRRGRPHGSLLEYRGSACRIFYHTDSRIGAGGGVSSSINIFDRQILDCSSIAEVSQFGAHL